LVSPEGGGDMWNSGKWWEV